MSAGEAETTRFDLASHLVLIGGPDYNALTGRVLDWDTTQFTYRSPDLESSSSDHPDEIVLYDSIHDEELCHTTDTCDFGYFERIPNRHNPRKTIVLVGGCHTIGVTGAVKTFSMAESERGEIPKPVLENAKRTSRRVRRARAFSVRMRVDRVGQTISTPIVEAGDISVRK